MSYNQVRANGRALSTAGKITILTMVSSLVVFLAVFLLNLGQAEINSVQAQSTATTSVNVLNTPPEFLLEADEPNEENESSVTNPTNSGDEVAWVATATDQNNAPYFLIVCETNAATAVAGDGNGTAAPVCTNNDQIAISTSTASANEARAATTTTEAMAELNTWYAFACDDDSVNPECSAGYQGTTTTASPFVVNHRPTFDNIVNDGPVDPGNVLTFTATATDTDTSGAGDTVKLHVCVANDYNSTTDSCGPGGTIASSTLTAANPSGNPAAATTTQTPYPDDTYDAYVFLVDNHGHEASGGQFGVNNQYDIANVAPTIDAAQITLNGGNNLTLDTAEGQTTGFTLDFVVNDGNSCENSAAGSEINNYVASVFRSGVGSSSCAASGDYDANDCYPSTVGSSTWNISCAATTTGSGACGGTTDATETWECTFPLWFIADPTDPAVVTPFYEAEDWRAAVSAVDDDSATSSFTQSSTANIEVVSFLSFDLATAEIPYGSLAPGDIADASSTINTLTRATGNVGLDQDLSGVRMCPGGTSDGSCPNTSTSSIPETKQQYATTTFTYNDPEATALSAVDATLDLNVEKSTTTTPSSGATYWALEVPGTISLAGSYTGRNSFTAVTSASNQWY